MNSKKNIAFVGLLAVAAAGCTTATDSTVRPEAITLGAGNAQAANTVLQMVDPWPEGVDDTRIKTPADVDQYKPEDGGEESAGNVPTSAISD